MKEWMKYICNGGATTLVNYSIYILLNACAVPYLISNTLAWVFAVLFAYYTNRKWVFSSCQDVKKEFFAFVSLRFTTLLIENLLLFAQIQFLQTNETIAKVLVSFVTIVLNYVICKQKIFLKGEQPHG